MKYRYTEERKIDRHEVAYMLRDDLVIIENTTGLNRKQYRELIIKFVQNEVRPRLPYSKRTNDLDIYLSIHKALKEVLQYKC